MSNWIVGIASGAIGLFGLLLSSRALDVGIEIFGGGLFVFGTLMVFLLIKKGYDVTEADGHAARIAAE